MADSSNDATTFNTEEDEPREVQTGKEEAPASTLYPKIFKLANVVFKIRSISVNQSPSATIPLIGSTKLHGTHADIVFESATVHDFRLQSKNQLDLKAGKVDNAGFAAWVASLGEDRRVMLRLRDRFVERYQLLNPGRIVEGKVIIAAEWCGMGIQKKVAINKAPRFMAVVSLFINGSWVPDWEYADIENAENRIFNIGRVGYFRHDLRIDEVGLTESESEIRRLTDEVERECPFAKQVCGESGLGEGIVWKAVKYCGDPTFWFKSKGDELAVSHLSKLPASAVDKENMERVSNFAKAIVTENRMEQGWNLLGQKDIKSLGVFLKWVTEDCLVEEKLEMERLDISRTKLSPAITSIAKPWYLKQLATQHDR